MADTLKRKLCELGLEVYEDKAGEEIVGPCSNIIGILKGTKGTLCSCLEKIGAAPLIEAGGGRMLIASTKKV